MILIRLGVNRIDNLTLRLALILILYNRMRLILDMIISDPFL